MLFFEEDTSKKNTLLTPYSWILRHDWKNPIPGSRSKHTGAVQREAMEMPHRLPRAIMEATCWEGTYWVGSQHGMAAAIGRGLVLRSGKTGFSVRPWHASFQDWFWLGWVLSISIYEISPYSRTRPLFSIPKLKQKGLLHWFTTLSAMPRSLTLEPTQSWGLSGTGKLRADFFLPLSRVHTQGSEQRGVKSG